MLSPIVPPRGLRHLEGAVPRIISGFLLMLATSVWLYSQNVSLFRGWSLLFAGLSTASGVPSVVTMSMQDTLAIVVHAPYAVMPMLPSIGIVLALAAFSAVASFVIPSARVPARYFMRVIAVVLVLPALGFFGVDKPAVFDLENHIAQFFRLGYWFLLVLPIIYAVTGFILPGNVAKRFSLVLLALVFFYFTIPVLALLHFHVILLAGPAISPLLNVFFGILILSIELIAFYGLLASVD